MPPMRPLVLTATDQDAVLDLILPGVLDTWTTEHLHALAAALARYIAGRVAADRVHRSHEDDPPRPPLVREEGGW